MRLICVVRLAAGHEVIEQPTTGKKRGLVISDPAADGSQVDEAVCDSLDIFGAGLSSCLRRVHRFPVLDQIVQ